MSDLLRDNDRCPWGKYEGTVMEDIPASYLLFIEQQDDLPLAIQEYINWSRSALVAETTHGGKLW